MKFICRGISKETGKFVYGYPFRTENEVNKSWYILTGYTGYSDSGMTFEKIKITQEPDRWSGLTHKNGQKYWENDLINLRIEYPSGHSFKNILKIRYEDATWFLGDHYELYEVIVDVHKELKFSELEIISSSHNIKEQNEDKNGTGR